ncbi:exodeoxyribonuclease V subunit beta [Fundidesulfovibrio soli]|uniref:exodeoxyribonuclease V subunit beta n=1 Tax=Fundidesulfovibrio soli TaxID=2922716 RepID=UPI001FAFE515|nr:exodeoxyribonuclease V subunit beta [Fundidesulfovibrio soli]
MSSPARRPLDLLNAPLSDCNVIVEASAGTGKTYALAALYLRLVVEAGLDVGSILVVTFTEAATAELKTRIRARISQARGVLVSKGTAEPDDFLAGLLARVNPELAEKRLSNAARDLDRVGIYTIHGFCRRMLTDFAFECGAAFNNELITDESRLILQLVEDYFRRNIQTADEVSTHTALAGGLIDSLEGLAKLLGCHPLIDVLDADPAAPDLALAFEAADRVYQRAADGWTRHGERVARLLREQTALSRKSYKPEDMTDLSAELDAYFAHDRIPLGPMPKCVGKLCSQSILNALKKGQNAPSHPFFMLCDELAESLETLGRAMSAFLVRLRIGFSQDFPSSLQALKQARGILGFSDLLVTLHDALLVGHGSLLRQRIRERFKAALIDEFQDTDTLQYHIFSTLFSEAPHPFYCIGDPKQAIYAFRGADIHAYLEATAKAGIILTQSTNHRSDPGMVQAVGDLFGPARRPFVHEGIPFECSTASEVATERLTVEGDCAANLRIWHLKAEDFGKEPGSEVTKDSSTRPIAKAVAEEIARLLTLSAEGRATFAEHGSSVQRPLSSSDFAVLVKSHKQAGIVRDALAERGIPCVLQQTEDVLDTGEAMELHMLLLAIARFSNEGLLRGALATDLLGWDAQRLDGLEKDERLRDDLLVSFEGYRIRWEREGVLGAASALLAEYGVRQRLLAHSGGERRLTNLMHCLELLHAAEAESGLGVDGLLAWFSSASHGNRRDEESKLRLETDAPAVRIMTIHASKGLEFNIVFCPYLGWEPKLYPPEPYHDPSRGGAFVLDLDEARASAMEELGLQEKTSEDMRLFYVAVTRAKSRCYLAWGAYNKCPNTPMARLLGVAGDGHDANSVKTALTQLAAHNPRISVSALPTPGEGAAPEARPDHSGCSVLDFTRQMDDEWGISSFTALSGFRERTRYGRVNDEQAPGEAAPDSGPDPSEGHEARAHELPAGTLAGVMYHEFFENMDFQAPGTDLFKASAATQLARHGMDTAHAPNLATLARRVLDAVLPGGVRLAEVLPSERRAEAGFHTPLARLRPQDMRAVYGKWSDTFPHPWHDALSGWYARPREGFLTGSMDLFYRHGGRYYLLDWKSNRLGSGPEAYSPERLATAMASHWYFLQYHLYCLALERHLEATVPGYDREEHFGGVHYLFIRGIDPDRPGHGVFFDRPVGGFMKDLERAILSPPAGRAGHAAN